MIERYSRTEMAQIWSDQTRYRLWGEVEVEVCRCWAEHGLIPKGEWKILLSKLQRIQARGGVPAREVENLEKDIKHDVLAFTTALAKRVGKASRWVHFGLTSSDVVDSALSMQVQLGGEILLGGVDRLLHQLKTLARKYRKQPAIGRSHGMFAEPMVFGLKFLSYYVEWQRNRERLVRALEQMAYGKLSGAVGVNPHLGHAFEKRVLRRLGLKVEPVSTQVVPRDRHAELLSVLAILGGSLERIAIELRHLQRSEVAEAREGFSRHQKGSSAMPHKRNPISSENLTGVARLLRSYAQAALENIALWHERDISHSSVERVILPDSFLLLDYALHRMTGILSGLEVNKTHLQDHLEQAGSIAFSGHILLALVEAGVKREDAYLWVQRCALDAIESGVPFEDLLSLHPKINRVLDASVLRRLCSLEHQLRHVPGIYQRTLGSGI